MESPNATIPDSTTPKHTEQEIADTAQNISLLYKFAYSLDLEILKSSLDDLNRQITQHQLLGQLEYGAIEWQRIVKKNNTMRTRLKSLIDFVSVMRETNEDFID